MKDSRLQQALAALDEARTIVADLIEEGVTTLDMAQTHINIAVIQLKRQQTPVPTQFADPRLNRCLGTLQYVDVLLANANDPIRRQAAQLVLGDVQSILMELIEEGA